MLEAASIILLTIPCAWLLQTIAAEAEASYHRRADWAKDKARDKWDLT